LRVTSTSFVDIGKWGFMGRWYLILAAGVVVACSSSNGNDPGGATTSGDFLTITGTDQGSSPKTVTIPASGVQCQISTVGGNTSLRIDASSSGSSVLLTYWNFDTTKLERDETFPPPSGMSGGTFELLSTGSYYYTEPGDWTTHSSGGVSCHTSFTRIDTLVAGTFVCHNLFNDRNSSLAEVTVAFSCPAQ
jgi:hypothetical protein